MKLAHLTDDELKCISTAVLAATLNEAIYAGRDGDALRLGRVLRARREAGRPPPMKRGAWLLPYNPDDDCDERGVVE
jgi:hypothetical protein